MADEKTTIAKEGSKAVQTKKDSKFVAFFKNLPQRIATPFKNMWHELKKVTWPTKKDLIQYTSIVLVFMCFMGIVIGLLDMGASKLVTVISSGKATATQAAATADATETGSVEEPAADATVEAAAATENAN